MKPWLEKNGKYWRIRWVDSDGRKRSCQAGKVQREARKKLKAVKIQLRDQKDKIPQGRITFKQFEIELEEKIKPLIAYSYWILVKQGLKKLRSYCNTHIDSVTPRIVDGMIAEITKRFSPATANKYMRVCRAVFGRAVKWGYIETNPFMYAKALRESRREIRILSPEDEGRIVKACRSIRDKGIFYLALDGGLRAKEIANLDIHADYDGQKGLVTVRNRDMASSKTRLRNVYISVPHREEMRFLQNKTSQRVPYPFYNRRAQSVSQRFGVIAQYANVDITLHDLRRTCASRMANAGHPAQIVMEYMGHADIKTTLRYYTKIQLDSLRRAREGTDDLQDSLFRKERT